MQSSFFRYYLEERASHHLLIQKFENFYLKLNLHIFSQMDIFNHHHPGGYLGNYRNSFSAGCGVNPLRRESSDSGYLMSLPESRRDSEVDSFGNNGTTVVNFGRTMAGSDLRRDSEDYFSTTQQQLKVNRQPEKRSEYQTLVLNYRPFGKVLAVALTGLRFSLQ